MLKRSSLGCSHWHMQACEISGIQALLLFSAFLWIDQLVGSEWQLCSYITNPYSFLILPVTSWKDKKLWWWEQTERWDLSDKKISGLLAVLCWNGLSPGWETEQIAINRIERQRKWFWSPPRNVPWDAELHSPVLWCCAVICPSAKCFHKASIYTPPEWQNKKKGNQTLQITNDLTFTMQVSNGRAVYSQPCNFVSLPQDRNSSHTYFSPPHLKILLQEPL